MLQIEAQAKVAASSPCHVTSAGRLVRCLVPPCAVRAVCSSSSSSRPVGHLISCYDCPAHSSFQCFASDQCLCIDPELFLAQVVANFSPEDAVGGEREKERERQGSRASDSGEGLNPGSGPSIPAAPVLLPTPAIHPPNLRYPSPPLRLTRRDHSSTSTYELAGSRITTIALAHSRVIRTYVITPSLVFCQKYIPRVRGDFFNVILFSFVFLVAGQRSAPRH